MARTDAIVLGAGIVGTSAALHLAKRGLAVALVDRRGPGEETSYGNAGVIEGNTLFPHAFPSGFGDAAADRVQAGAGGELSSVVPAARSRRGCWPTAPTRAAEGSLAFAEAMRPLFSRAVGEHEALMAEAGATRYLRKDGWIKLYRSDEAFAATARERELAAELGLDHRVAERRRDARARALARRRCSATRCIGRTPPACPIRSRSPRPMRRASPRSAASCSTATRGRCIARTRTGGSTPMKGRSMPRTRWWRSGPGRRICSARSASSCRSSSSAAITGISGRAATPG